MNMMKVVYGSDIRLFRVPVEGNKYSGLVQFLDERFSLKEGTYTLHYIDDESDRVMVSTSEELEDALNLANDENRKFLKIFVTENKKMTDEDENKTDNSNSSSGSSDDDQTTPKDFCCDFVRDAVEKELVLPFTMRMIKMIKEKATTSGIESVNVVELMDVVLQDKEFEALATHSGLEQVKMIVRCMIAPKIMMFLPFILNADEAAIASWIAVALSAGKNAGTANMFMNCCDGTRRQQQPRYRRRCRRGGRGMGQSCAWKKAMPDPMASVTRSLTLPDGSFCPPDTVLVKSWKLKNTGFVPWGENAHLVYVSGEEKMLLEKRFAVPNINPKDSCEVKAVIKTPTECGRYQIFFRMQRSDGILFGPKLWVDLFVVEDVAPGVKKNVIIRKIVDKNQNDHFKAVKKDAKLEDKQIQLEKRAKILNAKLQMMSAAASSSDDDRKSQKAKKKMGKNIQKLEAQMVKLQQKKEKIKLKKHLNQLRLQEMQEKESNNNNGNNDEEIVEENKPEVESEFIYADQLKLLMGMGFLKGDSILALMKHRGSTVDAIQDLLN